MLVGSVLISLVSVLWCRVVAKGDMLICNLDLGSELAGSLVEADTLVASLVVGVGLFVPHVLLLSAFPEIGNPVVRLDTVAVV